jgi:hypothetical protein
MEDEAKETGVEETTPESANTELEDRRYPPEFVDYGQAPKLIDRDEVYVH